jgi:dolichyl-phosphate-mannose--protein O-mannosyl transferase
MQSGGIQKIIDYQVHMFSYHSSLQATHAYSSAWWSWILDIKPMCYYREMNGEAFSSITVFGNPALFWMGTISILYLIFISIKKASLEAIFILFAFLGLYLPYMFVSRVMFIYHFYYAVPFMLLGILYMWRDLIRYSPKFYKFFIIFMAIVAGLFLLFYPVLSGYEVTKNYVNSYLVWFSGWWL